MEKKKNNKVIVINNWLYTKDEDGKIKVKLLNLANYLMNKYHFTFNLFDPHGFWWEPNKKQWHTHADRHLKKIIPEVLESEIGIMSGSVVSAIVSNITTSKGVDESLTDKFALESRNRHLVVFKNGTYDLDKDKILPNKYDNYILQNHEYDLGEIPEEETVWDRWLKESIVDPNAKRDDQGLLRSEGDQKAVEVFKAYIGWAMAGSYKEFQHFLLIYGNGGEGKSTMLNMVENLFGQGNVANVDLGALGDSDKARFNLAKLNRKELNYSDDIGNGFIKETNILKRLTGGNRMTAEYKGKDPFEFTNEAKLIFTCNNLPSFSDTSHGMERRPIIIEWRRIKGFKEKYSMDQFERDKPAFVRECLVAYKSALQNAKNMVEPRLPMTEFMEQRAKEWIQANDVIGNWLAENCELGEDQKVYREQTAMLYNNYVRYCKDSGVQHLGITKFNVEMKNRGIEPNKNVRINGKQHKCYVGVRRIEKYGSDLY
ncbi:DNA primase family protein [Limosilactobacillus mucosae]|uniref:DNA primase family protein n=1 Tax=Limosilactobacillus mucosae TaxID=97478 RepID=UPI0040394D7B